MSNERLKLSVDTYQKAVAALRLALDQPEDEFMRDSIIKRFELCFETGRKAAQRWLRDQDEVGDSDTKKQVMEAAFRTGLMRDAEAWSALGVARNDTSHEYIPERAMEIVAMIREQGMPAFQDLLVQLTQRVGG